MEGCASGGLWAGEEMMVAEESCMQLSLLSTLLHAVRKVLVGGEEGWRVTLHVMRRKRMTELMRMMHQMMRNQR